MSNVRPTIALIAGTHPRMAEIRDDLSTSTDRTYGIGYWSGYLDQTEGWPALTLTEWCEYRTPDGHEGYSDGYSDAAYETPR